ncbi:MAG: glutathione S-transferase N-terminal domain-containing protein [Bacteriovoracaceae bacterium]|nr:glutathione S-transferase N-terminal domain-containing protein [Bacteriovoracaceae bacterium]
MQKKTVIYTINPCPYCQRAKDLLNRKKIVFEEVLIDRNDDEARMELAKKSSMRTFPQIFYGEKLIGGYSELQALEDNKTLEKVFEL